jgi:nifR3 family TIM-barrel protein
MAGISTPIYRLLCQEKGATLTFTEMVSARALVHSNKATLELIARRREEKRVAAQLFGNSPSYLARAARIVEEAGFCLVDVNMGCPVRKVVTSGAGAALMKTPALAAEIVAAVRESVAIPVTAKIRSGWDSGRINAVEVARRLEGAGLNALTVHARTRDQGYSGKADWSVIAAVAAKIAIPVIGNGDVVDGPSALRLLEETGCRGIMIGRAALGNPWIFEEVRGYLEGNAFRRTPPVRERALVCLRHLRGTIAESGPHRGIRQFRTHATWYTKGFRNAADARRRLQRARSAREIMGILKDLYGLT